MIAKYFRAKPEAVERTKDGRVDPTFEHQDGRGFNGGHRDDRIFDEHGRWMNAAVHAACNGAKGSRRFRWIRGVYIEVQREPVFVLQLSAGAE